MNARQFAISAHSGTNHFYDTYLPYEFHLRMVVKTALDFKQLIPQGCEQTVIDACWLHDVIEDCRCSYNDVLKASDKATAEIVRACTNYTRGRNRYERMPDECYNDIRETPMALFVKLCDRIANVQYSKMSGSGMFEMYKREQMLFEKELNVDPILTPMWDYLNGLFD